VIVDGSSFKKDRIIDLIEAVFVLSKNLSLLARINSNIGKQKKPIDSCINNPVMNKKLIRIRYKFDFFVEK
jgi:hypothetical protein